MNKKIVSGCILSATLLILLSIAPTIYADITPEEEYIEFTTEVCGLRGYEPKTVRLTQSQADEVDRIFENLRMQLNGTVSLEETVKIYTDAVDELDRFGLLGDISVHVMKQLIQRQYQLNKLLGDKLFINSEPLEEEVYENQFCFITGRASASSISGYLKFFSQILFETLEFFPRIGFLLYSNIYIFTSYTCLFHQIGVIHFLDFVYFGFYSNLYDTWHSSEGWLSTTSGYDAWQINGTFSGNFDFYSDWAFITSKLGVVNFCGIKILDYILGIASHVKIKTVDDT